VLRGQNNPTKKAVNPPYSAGSREMGGFGGSDLEGSTVGGVCVEEAAAAEWDRSLLDDIQQDRSTMRWPSDTMRS
jgi:hypothetical protein